MEKELNEQESISIIQQMIEKVKADIDDDSFYNLLWGWLVFAASIGNYILLKANYEYAFLPWMLMPLGAIVTFLYARKHKGEKRVSTYVDDFLKYVLIAFGISLVMVLFFQSKLQLGTYPMVMMVYGIWLFISGGVIRFRPLMVGGVINWILACVAFFVSFEMQLLILALAVLLGYIIPGYMLRNKFANPKS